MAIRREELERDGLIPAQRAPAAAPALPAVRETAERGVVAAEVRLLKPARPSAADVAVGAVSLAVDAVRSAADVGRLAGQVAFDRLPLPRIVRSTGRRVWLAAGSAGTTRRAVARTRLASLLDAAVPLLIREVLTRVDLPALVEEYVDLDRIAAGLDVDAVAARLDVDRVVDRVDLDRAVARVDLDAVIDRIDLDDLASRIDIEQIIDRLDLDRVVERVDLDRVIDRLDLDRAAARLDLDPILERADLVNLARYVIDAIDLPGLIRSSTGSMTSDVVRGVRTQGADADEAVQRVVDRLLRRRGPRNDLAPRSDRSPGGER